MDDDTISRQAAIDAVSRGCQELRGVFARCEKNLNALPSAERYGRWILGGEIGWPKWTCSVCGGDGRGDYDICPWCGAKMDEPDDTYCTEENCEIFNRDLSCDNCNR